jgi:hypothetical protein
MILQQTQIKEVILNNKDGFTCDFKGNPINKKYGYFVGISNIKGTDLNNLIEKVFLIKLNGFLNNKNLFIGGWKYKKTFYLDLSLYIKETNLSEKIGRIFNQKAIFDIKNKKEIYL